MTSLYEALAAAKTKGSSDGDYFNPNQKGVVLLHGVKLIQKATKQTAIIIGEIVESNAKVAGAKLQTPGTKVKRIYPLSKYDWAIDDLKTDLVRIMGLNEKDLAPNAIASIFKDVFEGTAEAGGGKGPDFEKGILRGVLVGVDTSVYDRSSKGKVDLTNVNFFEVEGNTPETVAKRVKEIIEPQYAEKKAA